MFRDLTKVRNIGISAHIDSGKTTLTERILFYTQRIHRMGEVRGRGGQGAKMDSMELERERGITIASAATHCVWDGRHINIIDTPGHVDFTIEVERALRVLDGAILILCAVGGVQSQSITVDRQMRRYNVPRLAFVNKCDRVGADPERVTQQLREKLKLNAVMLQIPIGLEAQFSGVIDLVAMEAIYFEGPHGAEVRRDEVPDELREAAERKRAELIDAATMFSDELLEAALEGEPTKEQIQEAVLAGVLQQALCPVLVGSAYKNKGVQPLLDAIVRYLPNPLEVKNEALDLARDEARFVVEPKSDAPLLAYAFKLEDGPYGQLTYIRMYQGVLRKGDTIVNSRTGRKTRIGRLVRMHANEMEEIDDTMAGDIVALFGIDCASGDTFTDGSIQASMASMFVPEPVVKLRLKAADNKAKDNLSRALQRFSREDPTFHAAVDEETGETVVAGMGELHLDVYIERMRREYGVALEVGLPQVAYREAVTQRADFDYTHRKQTGGAGQYGKVVGYIKPSESGDFEFENRVVGGRIPTEYIPAVEKGFRAMTAKGELVGFPIIGLRVVLEDGNAHNVDSSEMAFQAAARGAFREAYGKAAPKVLEPIMAVSVEAPPEYHGDVLGTLMQRRGIIIGTNEDQGFVQVEAHVPLAEMFAYATVLRSTTQGKAGFTMEFAHYAPAPEPIAEEQIAAYREKRKG
ncbi:MAG: elongation factor G [Candidatus Eisenbacteria bacterium]|nr:elongation factor G [Candidatus Eisenbacteria bacterium]